MAMNRRTFAFGATTTMFGLGVSPVDAHAIALQGAPSGGFGMTYGRFCNSDAVNLCNANETSALFTLDSDFTISRGLPPDDDKSPIFRISVEEVGDATAEEIRAGALALAPKDAVQVGEQVWADGSIYQVFRSTWLAERFPNRPHIWSRQQPGTFGLVIMNKIAKKELARGVLTLPQAEYSIQDVEEQVKPNGRSGFTLRMWMDELALAQGKLIALERAIYEYFGRSSGHVFGVAFAYSEGNSEVLSGFADVGRAAASLDGKGFSGNEGRSFLIKDDEDGTFQAAIVTSGAEQRVYELAK